MYTAVKYFVDIADHDHSYSRGDTFPREGASPSEERLAELLGMGLIKQVKKKPKKKDE